MFDLNALLQFIPQIIIATVVSVYFIYEMDRRKLPELDFILHNKVVPGVSEKGVNRNLGNNYEDHKTPFDPRVLEKNGNAFFIGIQTTSVSLWTGLFLAFTPTNVVKIFIPVKSGFLDSLILITLAALFSITFIALYSVFMSKGWKRLAMGEAAAVIIFFVVTYFPSFSWFSSLSILVRIVVIYFYSILMLFLIYAFLSMKSRKKKLAIFLYGSIFTYGTFAVLLFSELILKFKI